MSETLKQTIIVDTNVWMAYEHITQNKPSDQLIKWLLVEALADENTTIAITATIRYELEVENSPIFEYIEKWLRQDKINGFNGFTIFEDECTRSHLMDFQKSLRFRARNKKFLGLADAKIFKCAVENNCKILTNDTRLYFFAEQQEIVFTSPEFDAAKHRAMKREHRYK